MTPLLTVLEAVERINAAIREGVPEKTVEELMNPDAQLPEVYPSAADLYQRELSSLQQQSQEVQSASNRQSHSSTLTQQSLNTTTIQLHDNHRPGNFAF